MGRIRKFNNQSRPSHLMERAFFYVKIQPYKILDTIYQKGYSGVDINIHGVEIWDVEKVNQNLREKVRELEKANDYNINAWIPCLISNLVGSAIMDFTILEMWRPYQNYNKKRIKRNI